MSFNRLKKYRERSGLTQEQLAGKLGMKLRRYQTYERGQVPIMCDVAIKAAKVLGATVDEVFNPNYVIDKLEN